MSGVVAEAPGRAGALRFVHVLIRDALYDELPATRRLRLHRDVGEALEALYAHDPEPHLAELAHHFRQAVPAADAERAVRYATRAGDRAALLLAYEEAARLYVVALELVDDAAGSSELLLRLGDVQARQGDIAASKETFVRAADTARAAGCPSTSRAPRSATAAASCGRGPGGDERLVPLLEGRSPRFPRRTAASRSAPHSSRGRTAPGHASLPRPRHAGREAVDMARRLARPATLAYALEGTIRRGLGPGRSRGAARARGRADRARCTSGDAVRAYAGHDCRFIALLESGELPAARRDHEAGTRLAYQLRQPRSSGTQRCAAPSSRSSRDGSARRRTPFTRLSPWAIRCRA